MARRFAAIIVVVLVGLLVAATHNSHAANAQRGGRRKAVVTAWQQVAGSRRELVDDDDEESLVDLNVDGIFGAFSTSNHERQSRGGSNRTTRHSLVSFELPEAGEVVCDVADSLTFHPDLLSKFPGLVLKSGVCSDGREVHLNFMEDRVDSFSATFTIPASIDFLYVDNHKKGSRRYRITRAGKKSSDDSEPHSAGCGTTGVLRPPVHNDTDANGHSGRRLQTCTNVQAISMTTSELTKDFVVSSTLSGSSPDAFSCGSIAASRPIITYSFTAPRAGAFTFSTCKTTGWNSVIRLRSGSCTGTSLSCNDNIGASTCSEVTQNLSAGSTYFIQVGTSGGGALPASITLTVTVGQIKGRIFRFALGVNRNVAVGWGSSQTSVATNAANLMSRLNALLRREVGIILQLIPNNNLLFCSDETEATYGACNLPNTATELMNAMQGFVQTTRGIPSSDYDLGHGLSTANSGVAYLGVVCNSVYKASGSSGIGFALNNPTFAVVDMFGHEIGHMLSMDHTMSNCFPGAQVSTASSVEPGSGSTIMSYSGSCNNGTVNNNVVGSSDPYYHSKSLEQARNHLNSLSSSCGVALPDVPAAALPTIASPAVAQTCTIPTGSLFRLRGQANDCPSCVFQWDTVLARPGVSFRDTTLWRFRSWRPTSSSMRYFLNLVYLTNKASLTSQTALAEILPTANADVPFRFIAKTKYVPTLDATEDAAQVGSFAYSDITLSFTSSQQPLAFTTGTITTLTTGTLVAGASMTFNWTPGGSSSWSSQVDILVAVNTLTTVNANSFNYETTPVDLAWVTVGRVANTGSATLTLPAIAGQGVVTPLTVAFMIITVSEQSDVCAIFDFVPRATYANGTPVPTPPSLAPTFKTSSPTKTPTVKTSSPTVPTGTPTFKTSAPSQPTKAPTTRSPTPLTASPSTRSPTLPTSSPITRSPTPPTGSPTTKSPTLPTTAPTTKSPTIPTRTPSRSPTFSTSAPVVSSRSPTLPTAAPVTKSPTSKSPTSRSPTGASSSPTRTPTLRTNSPTVGVQPPTLSSVAINFCKALPGQDRTSCQSKVTWCGQNGIRMKWAGAGCPRTKKARARVPINPDSGCQCASFCSYGCISACKADSACYWVGNRNRGKCYSRATKKVAVLPPSTCALA